MSISKTLRFLRAFDRKFFDGPAVFNYPGRELKGYRSVNLVIAQWIQAFSITHFTPAGRILFLATGYFLLAGMLSLLMPIYLLALTMSVLFLLDILIGWFLRPHLSVKRFLPAAVPPNQPFRVDYAIENLASSSAWDIYVDTVPIQHGIKLNRPRSFINFLGGHDSLRVTNEFIATHRGRFRFPLPTADSAFPFGLWRWGSHGPADKSILVYPAYLPLKSVEFPADYSTRAIGTVSSSTESGQSMDLLGCREFQYGDSARYIHARSSARLRQPIIKEFCNHAPGQILLIIDTFVSIPRFLNRFRSKLNKQFEASLSLAAATSDYLIADRYRISLCVIDAQGCHMVSDTPINSLSNILQSLAAMDACHEKTFPAALTASNPDLNKAEFAICFFLRWDQDRESFVHDLAKSGTATKTILISNESNSPDPVETDRNDLVQLIATDKILQGKVTEI